MPAVKLPVSSDMMALTVLSVSLLPVPWRRMGRQALLKAEGVRVRSVASTRALQPDIAAKDLADIDLAKGVVVNLRGRHFPSVAPGHNGDLLFLAVGRGNRARFADLEIAVALDTRGDWLG